MHLINARQLLSTGYTCLRVYQSNWHVHVNTNIIVHGHRLVPRPCSPANIVCTTVSSPTKNREGLVDLRFMSSLAAHLH